MNDSQCIDFLQWALPRLGMRWAGFRKVRRQVCNRARRRASELGLPDLAAYRAYLERHPDEWALLDQLTPITISRFYRDRGTFEFVAQEVLPALAAQASERSSDRLEVWSAGCASAEEPYTVAILWEQELADRFPTTRFASSPATRSPRCSPALVAPATPLAASGSCPSAGARRPSHSKTRSTACAIATGKP
jgi:chemotaxis protein methyltransferase CheR